MANKKIIDYKVITGRTHFFEPLSSDLFERLSIIGKHKNDVIIKKNQINLDKLKIEAIDSLLQLKTDKVYQFDEKETFRFFHLTEYFMFNKVQDITISTDTKDSLLSSKKSIENSIVKLETGIRSIEITIANLEIELEVLTEINSKIENLEEFNPVTFQMQQYANDGYVLQGGFYKGDMYGYQAMVKYEE